MLLAFIRYFFGYICIIIKGKKNENFLNALMRSRIKVWDISRAENVLKAKMPLKDFKRIRKLVRRSGVKVHVTKKVGVPFLLKRLRKRSGLLIGCVLCCLIIEVLSMYVWVVKVEGNTEIPAEEIKKVAEIQGLKPGVLKRKIDLNDIESCELVSFKNFSWVAVNIEGSFATISVNDAIKPPNIIPENEPCNIRAACDGQIIGTQVYKGRQEVKNGDGVVKGQLLVNGVVEDAFSGSKMVHASGKIIAITHHEFAEKINFKSTKKVFSSRKKVNRRIQVFGFEIPLSFNKEPGWNFKKTTDTKVLKLFDVPLPFAIFREEYKEEKEEEEILSKDEAKERAKQKIEEQKLEFLKDKKIVRENFSEAFSNNFYTLTLDLTCEENIALEDKID